MIIERLFDFKQQRQNTVIQPELDVLTAYYPIEKPPSRHRDSSRPFS